ncbi:MAG: hypothetical protein P8184_10295 [Calditrichia bacterium]
MFYNTADRVRPAQQPGGGVHISRQHRIPDSRAAHDFSRHIIRFQHFYGKAVLFCDGFKLRGMSLPISPEGMIVTHHHALHLQTVHQNFFYKILIACLGKLFGERNDQYSIET